MEKTRILRSFTQYIVVVSGRILIDFIAIIGKGDGSCTFLPKQSRGPFISSEKECHIAQ